MLVGIFILYKFSLFPVAIKAQDSSEWWSMSQKDFANTGYSTLVGTKTNNVLWNSTVGGWVWSDVAVVDGLVYVGCYDNKTYALDATNGNKVWEYETMGRIYSSPAVENGVVYIGSFDFNVYALDATTGEKIWSFPTESFVESSPTFSDGVVYFGSFDNKTCAVNATTGNQIWSVETGHDLCVQSSPAVANGVVYIGSSYAGTLHGGVFVLDTTDGSLVWEYKTDALVFAAPIVMDDVVYVGSSYMGPIPTEMSQETFLVVFTGLRGHVYALNASTGNQIWSYETGGAMYSSPAVVDEVLYVGSMDSNVYAFGSSNSQIELADLTTYFIIAMVIIVVVVVGLVILENKRNKSKNYFLCLFHFSFWPKILCSLFIR